MRAKYELALGCPPGDPRPGDLLPGILEGTGITLGAPKAKSFGDWYWDIPAEYNTLYEQHREFIASRIKALHERGVIRAGAW